MGNSLLWLLYGPIGLGNEFTGSTVVMNTMQV